MAEAIVLMLGFGSDMPADILPDSIQVDPETITWEDLLHMLKVYSDQERIHVNYVDEDGDEIIIESQEELNEAFKVARKGNNTICLLVRGEGIPLQPHFIGSLPSNNEATFYLSDAESGLVLDICGASTAPNAELILWPRKSMSEGVTNQLWYRYGPFIRSLLNGYCIDISGGNLVVNPYNADSLLQQWVFNGETLRSTCGEGWIVGVTGNRSAGVPVMINVTYPLQWKVMIEPRISAELYRAKHRKEDETRTGKDPLEEQCLPSGRTSAFKLVSSSGQCLFYCLEEHSPLYGHLIISPGILTPEYEAQCLWYRDGTTLRSFVNDYCIDISGELMVARPYEANKVTQQWTIRVEGGVKYIRNIHNDNWVVGVKYMRNMYYDDWEAGLKNSGVPIRVSSNPEKLAQLTWKLQFEPGVSAKLQRTMHRMEDEMREERPPLYSVSGYPFPYPFPKQPAPPPACETAAKEHVHHKNVVCNVCDMEIYGIRYKCGYCNDFDLCETCEAKPNIHDPAHILLKIRSPLYCTTDPLKMATVPPVSCPRIQYKPEVIGPALLCMKGLISADPGVVQYTEETLEQNNGKSTTERQAADAEFEGDETIPDGTHVDPGTTLMKKWRVRNIGTAPWASKTVLRYIKGAKMCRRLEVSVPYVEPGQSGTVEVELVAPSHSGNYESCWKLFNHGKAFGPDLSCSVTVEEKSVDDTTHDEGTTVEKDNETVDTTLRSVSLPSTPANTPLAVTPPYTPTTVKMAPLFAACRPGEEGVMRDELTNSIEKNEVNDLMTTNSIEKNEVSNHDSHAVDKHDELKAVVHRMEEMSIDSLDDAEGSEDSASDTESDDFYIVPIPDCFNVSLPARKEASTTVVVKKEDTTRSTYEEDETSAVWLPPPPVRFMNERQDSDSDLDSFSDMDSDLCGTRSVSSVEDLEEITVRDTSIQQQATPGEYRAAATTAGETNDLNKRTAASCTEGVIHGVGVAMNNNIEHEEEEEYRVAAENVTDNPVATEQPTQPHQQEVRDDSEGEGQRHDDVIEQAEEATETNTTSTLSNDQPRAKNDSLEDLAYNFMATALDVAKKAGSVAFCTAKDVYHTLQAKNSYSPPRSTWTPPENTWTPPASTWTPVQPTWSPSEQRWIQPETASPALDQLASNEAYIPPQGGPSAPPTPSPMQQLIEMGFANREMNARVLEAFDNDLEAAIQQLLQQDDDTQWYNTRH